MSDYVQVPTRSLDYLERAISTVNSNVGIVANRVDAVDNHIRQVDQQLVLLQKQFNQMIIEQRQQAAFQRAITEIIRVRQEVEQKFGTHKLVRDTLLGILQATDAALITDDTISKCSEQLLITVPEYWLAPCLVAIAAWIAGREQPENCKEKNLAVRAIKEAVKRDREKTCLLLALICRRNQKRNACFAWLSEYFALQNAEKTKKSVIAIIDAYSNGVFGEDDDKICEKYIDAWIADVKEKHTDFDAEQKAYWKNFFNVKGAAAAYKSEGYTALQEISSDFDKIDGFVHRITAFNNAGGVRQQLNKIIKAEVDIEALRRGVDDQLKRLVTNYEDGEESKLRDEEALLQKIKELKGDEVRAQKIIALQQAARQDPPVDFVSRLRSAVSNSSEPATQKTAVKLLKDYIIGAYKEYITENKDAYPEVINLAIKENVSAGASLSISKPVKWAGTTSHGENIEELKKEINKAYNTAKEQAIEAAKPKKDFMYWIKVIFTLSWWHFKQKKLFEENKAAIEKTYSAKAKAATIKLEKALGARKEADKIVTDFCAKEGWDEFKLGEE